tara:strand:+ start:1748 stop:2263 length:516 start_codon:yes stop_codon:yes gene_type:complete
MKPIYLLSLLFIFSCQKEVKNSDIDTAIEKYGETDFSYFDNTFIGIREKNRSVVTYIVGKSEGDLPVYFVRYSVGNDDVIEIDKTALVKKNVEDYFTSIRIQKLIENFRKFNLSLLEVDKDGNLFINPFQINEPAVLLRLAKPSNNKEIKKGFVYKHYTDRWYTRKNSKGA